MERITYRSHFKDTNGQFYKVRFTVCFACGTSGQIIVMGLFCFVLFFLQEIKLIMPLWIFFFNKMRRKQTFL